jgi:hypothetical protein
MLNATESAAFAICAFSDARSRRENPRIARRTFNTSSCALCHTKSRRKSCTLAFSNEPRQVRRPFSARLPESSPPSPLTTTNNCPTNQLKTQDLDSPQVSTLPAIQNLAPLTPISISLMPASARMQ